MASPEKLRSANTDRIGASHDAIVGISDGAGYPLRILFAGITVVQRVFRTAGERGTRRSSVEHGTGVGSERP